jgi:hypothetical protein
VKWQRYSIPLIFILGFCLRAYTILSQGLNADEAKAVAFVLDPSWTSITWDNYPPLFYLIGKFIALTPINPVLGLKLFVCLVSAGSLFFFLRLLKRQEIFPFWAFLLIAIWPVSIFYSTLVRPLILIEFFAILNYSYFEDLARGRRDRRTWNLFFASLVGLTLSTYVSAIYIAYLGFLSWRRKMLGELDNFESTVAVVYFLVSCAWMLAIRWKNLSWLFINVSLSEKAQASVFLLKNLLASDWTLLGLFAGLAVWRQSLESLAVISIVFAINLFTGMAIYEARFLLFFYPVLFLQLLSHLQLMNPVWLRHVVYAGVFLLSLQSVSSVVQVKRSGLAELQTISGMQNFDTIAGPLDQMSMAHLFPGKETASMTSLLYSPCCQACLVFDYSGFSKLLGSDMQRQLAERRFEILGQGTAGARSLQPFDYMEIKRQCP